MKMKNVVLIDQNFLSVELVAGDGNNGNNGDTYEVRLTAPGQPFICNGEDREEVSFTVVGNCELDDLLEGMAKVRKALRPKDQLGEFEEGFIAGKESAQISFDKWLWPFADNYAQTKWDWIRENIFRNMKPSGRYLLGLCPFHTERTPSCTYNVEKDHFHCFGCGKTGNGETLAKAFSR